MIQGLVRAVFRAEIKCHHAGFSPKLQEMFVFISIQSCMANIKVFQPFERKFRQFCIPKRYIEWGNDIT